MHGLLDPILLSRLQFAATTLFHILWPVLTIGLSLFLVLMEALWLRTGDADYYRHARFWARLFILNFGVGVATGLPLEFEFGTNWAPFASAAGSFFGNILGFEGAMAFMLEAGFLGIMMFGWNRVPRAMHLFATVMVAFGGTLSAFWIMDANSWMQTPTGGHMANGRFIIDSYLAAIWNPDFLWAFLHMWFACLETSLFVIGGIAAWYLLKGRDTAFFLKCFRWVVIIAMVVTPLQIYFGDANGKDVFAYQPAKGAALEGHWVTNAPGEPASWAIVAWPDQSTQQNDWEIRIPGVLSWLATGTSGGQVKGLKDFAPADQPPLLPVLFYGFRAMAGIGFALFLLMAWSVVAWARGTLVTNRWLLRAWVASIPLGYIAVDLGWTVREVGRQPWVIYGIMRTADGASRLPVAAVGYTLLGYLVAYVILGIAFVVFALRIIARGPDLTVPLPEFAAPRHQPREGHRDPSAQPEA
ncbi:MAG TPA: cytochrome ubiquinol oxidase subunit I [Stellaceae bacterium]